MTLFDYIIVVSYMFLYFLFRGALLLSPLNNEGIHFIPSFVNDIGRQIEKAGLLQQREMTPEWYRKI